MNALMPGAVPLVIEMAPLSAKALSNGKGIALCWRRRLVEFLVKPKTRHAIGDAERMFLWADQSAGDDLLAIT